MKPSTNRNRWGVWKKILLDLDSLFIYFFIEQKKNQKIVRDYDLPHAEE